MLNSIFNESASSISFDAVIMAGLVAVLSGLVISLTHKYTSRYNKNFLITLILLPLLVTSVILLVNGNLGMGLVVAGTFSLVRFRSVAGTSREIALVFFAMTIGLACGMGYILFAILLTIVGSLLIIIFSKIKLFEKDENEKYLKITIPEDMDYNGVLDDVLKKYTTHYNLLTVKTVALGSLFELKYLVNLKDNKEAKKFIDELRVKNGNLKIILTEVVEMEEL